MKDFTSKQEVLDYITVLEELGEYEYIDNIRIADQNSDSEMAEYERQQNDGCCGFHDEEILIDGKLYIFGFNYGH